MERSIQQFAETGRQFKEVLHLILSQESQARKTARADVDEWRVYFPINITSTKPANYRPLHDGLRHAAPYQHVFVNEYAPTDRRRLEYLNCLVSPSKCVRYSYSELHFVWKLETTDDEGVRQQKNDRIRDNLKSQFPVYHSRAMRRDFDENFTQKCFWLRPSPARYQGNSKPSWKSIQRGATTSSPSRSVQKRIASAKIPVPNLTSFISCTICRIMFQ